jgi:hypothetical protein
MDPKRTYYLAAFSTPLRSSEQRILSGRAAAMIAREDEVRR